MYLLLWLKIYWSILLEASPRQRRQNLINAQKWCSQAVNCSTEGRSYPQRDNKITRIINRIKALEKSELKKNKSFWDFCCEYNKNEKICMKKMVRCRESLMLRSPIPVLIHKIKELNRLNLYVDSGNIIITSYLKSTIYQYDNIAVKDNL